jgi:hypothetical protein
VVPFQIPVQERDRDAFDDPQLPPLIGAPGKVRGAEHRHQEPRRDVEKRVRQARRVDRLGGPPVASSGGLRAGKDKPPTPAIAAPDRISAALTR